MLLVHTIATAAIIEVTMALLMRGRSPHDGLPVAPTCNVTAILDLVPIGPTLFFGMRLGIWALVLLCRADVVAAFVNRAAGDLPMAAPADSAQRARVATVPLTSL